MDNKFVQLNETKARMSRACGILQWFFFALLIIYCIGLLFVAYYSVLLPSGLELVGPSSLIGILSVLCDVIAGIITLAVMWKMLHVVAKGHSPFTSGFVTALVVLAILLLIGAVSEALIPPGTLLGTTSDSATVAVEYANYSNAAVKIDAEGFLAATACFVLAAVFRYGSILQNEADDLI